MYVQPDVGRTAHAPWTRLRPHGVKREAHHPARVTTARRAYPASEAKPHPTTRSDGISTTRSVVPPRSARHEREKGLYFPYIHFYLFVRHFLTRGREMRIRIGLAYNEKPAEDSEPPSTGGSTESPLVVSPEFPTADVYAEWDEPATIAAVEAALSS